MLVAVKQITSGPFAARMSEFVTAVARQPRRTDLARCLTAHTWVSATVTHQWRVSVNGPVRSTPPHALIGTERAGSRIAMSMEGLALFAWKKRPAAFAA